MGVMCFAFRERVWQVNMLSKRRAITSVSLLQFDFLCARMRQSCCVCWRVLVVWVCSHVRSCRHVGDANRGL